MTWKLLQPLLVVFGLFLLIGSLQAQGETSPDCDEEFKIYRAADATLDNANLNYQLSQDDKWTWETVLADPHIGDDYEQLIVEYELPLMCKSASGMAEPICEFTFQWLADRYRENREAARGGLSTAQSSVELWRGRVAAAQLEESVASLRLMACQTGSETSLEAAISAGFAISEPAFQDEVARAVNEHIRVGMVAYNSGESGAALSRFEQAASMARPISPRAAAIVRYYKGNIYAGLGQWTSAIAEYNTAITLADPSPALYYYARGVVQTYLPDQQAGYEGAINDYLTALALEPGNPLYFFALGSAYTHLGRWAEALEALRQYVRLSQNDDPLILDYLDALVALVGYDIDDELTQTWITGLRQDDHGIAIRIPSSWDAREVAVTDGSGFLSPRHYEFYLSNSEFPALWVPPLNPGAGLQLVTGEVRVYVAAYPTQTLNPNVSADAAPIEVIAVANDNPDPEVLLEGPTEVSLGGKRAAYLVQRVPGTSFTRIFIAVELGEGMTAFMITYANLDEWEQFFDVILTIAATMNYAVDPQPISLDMDAEGDPNDPGATPTPVPLVMNSISYGETKDGVLTTTGSSFYQFNGSAGDEVTITLNSTDFDPLLELQNGSDTQIASNDNFDGSNTQISLVLPETGAYKIVVRSLNSGASGRFQLALVLNSAGNPIQEPAVEAEGLPSGALNAISDRMNPPDQPYSVTSTVRLTENIEIPLLSASAFGATLSENLIVLGESSDSYCVVLDRPLSLDLKDYDISILGHMLIVDLGGASSPIPTQESHFLIQREITPEILEYLDDPWRVIPASAMSGLERDWNDICGYRTGDAQYYVIPPTATPTSTPTPLPTATPVTGLSGILLFVRDNDIYRLEISGTETRLTENPDVYKTALAISPRGDMVAYIANDSSQHTMMSSHADSITVLDVNTGRTRNLTDPIDRQGFSRVLDGLAWSPDGTHIAFSEIARGENHVAISVVSAGAELTGTDTRIGVGDLGYTTYGNPAWSADGTRVYAITDGCSAACIRSFAADGRGEPVDVLPSDLSADILAFNLAVSPDGTKLAFYRLENDFYYVTVYDFASQQLILTQVQPRTDRFGLAWSPDGRQILTSAIDGLQNIPNAFGELYAFTPVDGPATDAIQITDDQAWGGAWLEPGTVVSVSPTPTVESDAPRESEAAISGRWEGSVDEGGLGYTTALSLNQCFPNQIVCGGATYSAGGCQAAISLISRDGNTIQLSQQGITGICHDAIIILKPIDAQTWSAVYVADGGFRSGEQFAEAQLTASRLSGFDHLSTPVPTFTPTWTASASATIQPTEMQTASRELLPTSATESVPANQIQQWATRAEASSEYSGSRWSAAQATGEPNTGACGDFDTAWASQTGTGRDRLTVYFDTPVIAERVNIYQTYNPGAIVNVELIPEDGGSPIPVRGSADPGTGCPGIFSLDVAMTYAGTVIGVNVILDQSITGNWNEIDAVQLIGRSGVDEVSAPTATRSPELIITAPGSYQSEIGCPASQGVDGDWAPDCTLSQLFDNDGDGIYTFITAAIPAGEYEAKVALDLNWALNYGADGIQDGANILFLVQNDGDEVEFVFDANTHLLTVTVGAATSVVASPTPALMSAAQFPFDPGTPPLIDPNVSCPTDDLPSQFDAAYAAFNAQDWRRAVDLYSCIVADGREPQGYRDFQSGARYNLFSSLLQCSVGYALTERNEEAVQCGARAYFNSASDDPSLSDYRFYFVAALIHSDEVSLGIDWQTVARNQHYLLHIGEAEGTSPDVREYEKLCVAYDELGLTEAARHFCAETIAFEGWADYAETWFYDGSAQAFLQRVSHYVDVSSQTLSTTPTIPPLSETGANGGTPMFIAQLCPIVSDDSAIGQQMVIINPDGSQTLSTISGAIITQNHDLIAVYEDRSPVNLTEITTPDYRQDRLPLISPDGHSVAFMSGGRLSVMDVGGSNRRRFEIAADQFEWTPDSQGLVFGSIDESRIGVVNVVSGEVIAERTDIRLSDLGDYLSVAADGSIVVVSGSDLVVYNADLTEETQITSLVDEYASSVAFSPDGQTIAYAARTINSDVFAEVFLIQRDGSNRRNLTNGAANLGSTFADLRWSSDGGSLLIDDPFTTFLADTVTGNVRDLSETADHAYWLPDGSGMLATVYRTFVETEDQFFRQNIVDVSALDADGSNPQVLLQGICGDISINPAFVGVPNVTEVRDVSMQTGEGAATVPAAETAVAPEIAPSSTIEAATTAPTATPTATTPLPTATPSLTPTITLTPTETVTPSLTPVPVTCPGVLTSRLFVGQIGRVIPESGNSANRVRSQPTTSAGQVGQIPPSGEFSVLEGPQCADGYAWWRVDYQGLIGWTAEGDATAYWLEPLGSSPAIAPTPAPVGVLYVGGQALVFTADEGLKLRDDTSTNSNILENMPSGTVVTLLEGPISANGYMWWRVRAPSGREGWSVESADEIETLIPVDAAGTSAESICIAVTDGQVNLRRGPGTNFDIAGAVEGGLEYTVNGQAINQSGFTWYRFENNLWARQDVVFLHGDCTNIPMVR